ncbi:dihydrolipoyl dehydrogenase [Pelagicoccus sp. SDUM812002]|uniref:dihydrolipoyl dehydrogenase family protein n=1 Tax=Pelagicoccus sp. SDUM812002 TaxID=3041266 RepID=UPI0028101DDB|nr:dihydrolipoyl dehydrogenase [Pelagicoccus sp. SDUM812002]MDQ8186855.1 dihydrolipoyl dehydrogenase [Pelagicoccus sp. SDUM812002]
MKTYDFIAIGGGSGGFNAARVARGYSDSVAVIDGAEELGGLCILRGCMPSKTLIYSAEVLHLAQNANKFGLNIPSATADMPALHKRKLDIIKEFTDYRVESMRSRKYDLYRSYAKFIDSNTLELADGTQLRGKKFIIGTGSKVSVPPIPGLEHEDIWTSDHVLDLDFLPESTIILGGGVVACELAQFLNRVGSKVTQIQRSSHILKDQAADVSETVEKAFRNEGLDLFTGTSLKRIEKTDTGYKAVFDHEGFEKSVTAQYVVNALGRTPNTSNLGLDNAGIDLLPNGQIKTDEHQRTTNPDVYAAGDCAGPFEIVHTAVLQGEYAARHAFNKSSVFSPLNYDHMLDVVFTDPQVARVGLTQKTLDERGIEYIAADYPFDDHGKSILMEAKYGFVRLFGEKPTGRILGAEIVSKDAGELIHALSVAVSNNLTAADLLKTHWYHPTLAEIISYPLEDIVDEL